MDRLRQGQIVQRFFHRLLQNDVEQRAHAEKEVFRRVVVAHQRLRDELARARPKDGDVHPFGARSFVQTGQRPHRRPLLDRLEAEQHDSLTNRLDLALDAVRRRIHATQHLVAERRVVLDQVLDAVHGDVRVVEHGEQLRVGHAPGRQRTGLEHRRLAEVIALKEMIAACAQLVVPLRRFHVLGDE